MQTFKVTSTLQNDRFLFLTIAFQGAKRERGKNPSLPNFTLDFHPHSRTFVSTVRPRSLFLDLLSNNARFFPDLAVLYFSHREEILVKQSPSPVAKVYHSMTRFYLSLGIDRHLLGLQLVAASEGEN